MIIPTIDITALAQDRGHSERTATVAAIGKACRDIGFLSITGTGVAASLIAEMRQVVQAIFAAPEDAKWDQAISRDNYRGYIPLGFFAPNDGTVQTDNYEGYKLHHEIAVDDPLRKRCRLYGPNIWPRDVPRSAAVILRYWAALDRVSHRLLAALEEALGIAPGQLTASFDQPLTNMTLLHYPPQTPEQTGYGIHPHKDTDALTIIAPDPVGGLEVKSARGDWISPTCPPGGLVVNIGDMLELWSGGRLVSTPHRVINRSGQERYSFPYFAVPRHDVTVAPLLPPMPGFQRPAVNCGHWSAEIWRTNWPDQQATDATPELGTLRD